MKRTMVLMVVCIAISELPGIAQDSGSASIGKTWKDIDYVGDGIVGHRLDIYLPKESGAPIQDSPDRVALANPVSYIDSDDPPFLIFHGNADPLVPFCQSDLLHRTLTEAGVPSTYMQISGGGHGDGVIEADTIKTMIRFFEASREDYREKRVNPYILPKHLFHSMQRSAYFSLLPIG